MKLPGVADSAINLRGNWNNGFGVAAEKLGPVVTAALMMAPSRERKINSFPSWLQRATPGDPFLEIFQLPPGAA